MLGGVGNQKPIGALLWLEVSYTCQVVWFDSPGRVRCQRPNRVGVDEESQLSTVNVSPCLHSLLPFLWSEGGRPICISSASSLDCSGLSNNLLD